MRVWKDKFIPLHYGWEINSILGIKFDNRYKNLKLHIF